MDWKDTIASEKINKTEKKKSRKLFKETVVVQKKWKRIAFDWRWMKFEWRWFQMTRGRSKKVLEVDWRKNCKSYKHFPLFNSIRICMIYVYLKFLSGISNNIWNARLFREFLSKFYTENSICLHWNILACWFTNVERKNTSLSTLPLHTSLLLPLKCNSLRRRRKQHSCLTEDSNIILCNNSYQREHQN